MREQWTPGALFSPPSGAGNQATTTWYNLHPQGLEHQATTTWYNPPPTGVRALAARSRGPSLIPGDGPSLTLPQLCLIPNISTHLLSSPPSSTLFSSSPLPPLLSPSLPSLFPSHSFPSPHPPTPSQHSVPSGLMSSRACCYRCLARPPPGNHGYGTPL